MTDILAKTGVSVWVKSPHPPKLHLLRYRRNTCLRLTNAGLFHYAGNNPVRYIDPDGRTNYVFYDPTCFSAQAKAESKRMPVHHEWVIKEGTNHYRYAVFVPEETVMISVTTEKEFEDAWNSMENPTDVTLIFHGGVHTLNIDYKTSEYLTTSPDGKTPLGNPATYIGNLEHKDIGTLKIYSCQGGNVKENDNVAQCFKKNNMFLSEFKKAAVCLCLLVFVNDCF